MIQLKDRSNKIRFAVLGTSLISKKFLEAAYMFDQFEFAAIYSRSIEKGRDFIHNLENIRVFDCMNEIAASKDIDAVYVASPTSFHASQSIRMLESHKHVLCEKPVASNLFEWENMLNASINNKVIILEAMRPIFTPGYKVVAENLRRIGKIRKVNFNFCKYSSRYDRFKNGIIENAFRPELSNGALMDLGIYCIEVLISLFGKPERINANGYIIPNSIDAMGSITAIYDGMQADLIYSKVSESKLPCEIQGEKGTIYFEHISAPQNIKIIYRNGIEERFTEDSISNNMFYEIETFINMINMKCIPEKYNKISSVSMEIMEESKKQIGIIFPADIER